MVKRCNYCGVELIETNNGKMCPNCGRQDEEGISDVKDPSYIG